MAEGEKHHGHLCAFERHCGECPAAHRGARLESTGLCPHVHSRPGMGILHLRSELLEPRPSSSRRKHSTALVSGAPETDLLLRAHHPRSHRPAFRPAPLLTTQADGDPPESPRATTPLPKHTVDLKNAEFRHPKLMFMLKDPKQPWSPAVCCFLRSRWGNSLLRS